MKVTPYSLIVARRAMALGLGLVALLLAAGWWQQSQQPPTGEMIFRPAQQIEDVLAAGEFLQKGTAYDQAASLQTIEKTELPCSGRQTELLLVRTMAALQIDGVRARATLLRAAAALGQGTECTRFTQAVRLALAMNSRDESSANTPWSAVAVERTLTEDVTWTRRIPCLLARDSGATLVLAGPPGRCGVSFDLASPTRRTEKSSFRRHAATLAQAVTDAGIAGRLPVTEGLWLTLDSGLQDRLDQLMPCRRQPGCRDWPELSGLQDVSIVVMDATSGTILAAWCDGPLCERAERTGGGALAAAVMEAPPASTAKLLFSLALASSSRTDPLMLQRQIKTSGQIDNQVSKRNEWWERQAICDQRPGEPCPVPARARRIADALGWNAQCTSATPSGGLRCGRIGLVSPKTPDLSAGQVGRLALPAGPEVGTHMLDWQRYDRVRSGQIKAAGQTGFTESSRAVQAVLGAGDSRTSALGLAVLPMQVWRLAHDLAPARPMLVLPQTDNEWPQSPGLGLPKAARVVLGGMRKAVEPAERGWQGSGTVAAAVAREFGRPCTGPCGIWAKTGTVSQQDPGYRGTTVLSAVVSTTELVRWAGQPTTAPAPERVLSIGIIARPHGQKLSGHAASHLGMGLVKHIIIPWSQS